MKNTTANLQEEALGKCRDILDEALEKIESVCDIGERLAMDAMDNEIIPYAANGFIRIAGNGSLAGVEWKFDKIAEHWADCYADELSELHNMADAFRALADRIDAEILKRS